MRKTRIRQLLIALMKRDPRGPRAHVLGYADRFRKRFSRRRGRLLILCACTALLSWAVEMPASATQVAQCTATPTAQQCQVSGSPISCTAGQVGTAARTSLGGAVTLWCGATDVAQDDGDPLSGPQPTSIKFAGPMSCVATGGATGFCTTTSPAGKSSPPGVPSATTGGLVGLAVALVAVGSILTRRRAALPVR